MIFTMHASTYIICRIEQVLNYKPEWNEFIKIVQVQRQEVHMEHTISTLRYLYCVSVCNFHGFHGYLKSRDYTIEIVRETISLKHKSTSQLLSDALKSLRLFEKLRARE